MFESNTTETQHKKLIDGVPANCEKIMVAKWEEELPSWFKHNPDYSPQPRSKAIVFGYKVDGQEVYIKARIKNLNGEQQICVCSLRWFRTVAKDKIKERLTPLAAKPNIAKILKSL